jgi:hypothetical protein
MHTRKRPLRRGRNEPMLDWVYVYVIAVTEEFGLTTNLVLPEAWLPHTALAADTSVHRYS